MHQAAVRGDVEEVMEMLSGGANPNKQDAHLQVRGSIGARIELYTDVRRAKEIQVQTLRVL